MIVFTSVTHKITTNKKIKKVILFYVGLTAFCILFDRVYFIFGHGVESPSMLWMFLYPLLGGVFPWMLVWFLVENASDIKFFRIAYNAFNTGMAILILGSALQGVIDIAGTTSPYTQYFPVVGWEFYGLGVLLFVLGILLRKPSQTPKT